MPRMIQMITIYTCFQFVVQLPDKNCFSYTITTLTSRFFTLATSKSKKKKHYSHYPRTCTRTDRKRRCKDSRLIIVEIINGVNEVILLQAQVRFCVCVAEVAFDTVEKIEKLFGRKKSVWKICMLSCYNGSNAHSVGGHAAEHSRCSASYSQFVPFSCV